MTVKQRCSCVDLDLEEVEKPVRALVRALNGKGICTHSSEGGGKGHGAPEFAYVEAHLTKDNLRRARTAGVLLDKVYGRRGRPLFKGSAIAYGDETGFHLIGICRRSMTDKRVITRLSRIPQIFKKQFRHAVFRRPTSSHQ